MIKNKCALVLITGDRIDYLRESIECNIKLIKKYDSEMEVDVFLSSFDDVDLSSIDLNGLNIKKIGFKRPDINSDLVINFPRSHQQSNQDLDLVKRVSFGHLILFGLVPNSIYENKDLFADYNFILKSRADLIYDFNPSYLKNFDINSELLTFECFWGGCRYNLNYTNDHFIFGVKDDVMKIISFPIEDCIMDKFWNPEQYMTYLYSRINKKKVEMSTDKYFLLSKDRASRKFIGYPMEKVNLSDKVFLENINIDFNKLNFTSIYDF